MAGKQHKKNWLIKALLWLLLILLLLGILVALVRCGNDDNTSFLFSLKYNDEKIRNAPFAIDLFTPYKIYVSDTLGKAFSDGAFSVKVIARATDNENFYFRVDDMTLTLADLPDLTEYFVDEKTDDYFVLKLAFDLPQLLQDIYGELQVSGVESFACMDTPLFNLVVTSAVGGANITVPLLVVCKTSGVTLDATHIVF